MSELSTRTAENIDVPWAEVIETRQPGTTQPRTKYCTPCLSRRKRCNEGEDSNLCEACSTRGSRCYVNAFKNGELRSQIRKQVQRTRTKRISDSTQTGSSTNTQQGHSGTSSSTVFDEQGYDELLQDLAPGYNRAVFDQEEYDALLDELRGTNGESDNRS